MKTSMKELFTRVVLLFLGLTIAHFGVTLFLISDLGADPFNVFVQGIYRTLLKTLGVKAIHDPQMALEMLTSQTKLLKYLTHGNVHLMISFLIIIVLLIVDRKYIKIGTVICMFCGGPIIDFFNMVLFGGGLPNDAMWFRVGLLAAGCVILAFGMTIVIKSEAGTGPNDLVALVISEKSGIRFLYVRVVVDVLFAGIGFLLGGTLGLGTVICACLVGPVADFFLPKSEKIVKTVLKMAGI